MVVKITILHLFMFPVFLNAQIRIDDAPPKVKQRATIGAMTGWIKNDLGKWSSAVNGLPKYCHEYFFSTCEEVIKIDLADVNYKGKNMLCVAKFMRYKFIHNNRIVIEYPVDYWLFDGLRSDTIVGRVETVQAIVYKTVKSNMITGLSMLSWKDIENDMIVNFKTDYLLNESLCIQMREDKKNRKVQFLIGSYNTQTQFFNFNSCLVPGENNEMENPDDDSDDPRIFISVEEGT